MANEPERPIEKLLRAAAQKRRDEAGAPFELHPADRRVLQNEVARQFAKPPRESRSFPELLGQLWPRFAWGVGILAVLGVSVWVLRPPSGHEKEEARFAQNQRMFEAAPAKAPRPDSPQPPAAAAPPPAPAGQLNPAEFAYADKSEPNLGSPARKLQVESQLLAKNPAAGPFPGQDAEKPAVGTSQQAPYQRGSPAMQVAASGGPSALAPTEPVTGATQRRYAHLAEPASAWNAPAAPAAAPAGTPAVETADLMARDGLAKKKADESGSALATYKSLAPAKSADRSGTVGSATYGLSAAAPEALREADRLGGAQRFVQVTPAHGTKAARAEKTTAAQPVLASFQVEQVGKELRIVDGDGSIYRGDLQLADATRPARPLKTEAPAAARASRVPLEAFEEKVTLGHDSDQLTAQSYSFRVVGTNRSLNKRVVFTGNLLAGTNVTVSLPIRTGAGASGRLGDSQDTHARTVLLPLSSSRISGRVVVGSGKPVEIKALPAKP